MLKKLSIHKPNIRESLDFLNASTGYNEVEIDVIVNISIDTMKMYFIDMTITQIFSQ